MIKFGMFQKQVPDVSARQIISQAICKFYIHLFDFSNHEFKPLPIGVIKVDIFGPIGCTLDEFRFKPIFEFTHAFMYSDSVEFVVS